MIELPGGVAGPTGIERGCEFKALTGEFELALAEAVVDGDPLPVSRVTRVLCAALAHVGGRDVDGAAVDALCVGDRQYLVSELAAHLGLGGSWLTARCGDCDTRFDFFVDTRQLPVKPAGAGYPYAEVETSQGRCRFRVPCGGDQRAVARLQMQDAVQVMLRRCVVKSEWDLEGLEPFSARDCELIEEALETVAPEVAVEATSSCPGCGVDQVVALSPYAVLDAMDASIFEEVHELAAHYHWSEEAIVALPRARRQRYVACIERARRQARAAGSDGFRGSWAS